MQQLLIKLQKLIDKWEDYEYSCPEASRELLVGVQVGLDIAMEDLQDIVFEYKKD